MTPSYPVVRSSLPLTRRSAILAAGGLLAVPLGGAASNRQRHRVHDGVHEQATQPFAYQRTIGVTGVAGSDNNHFSNPYGVTAVGNRLYVADDLNSRVQVFGIASDGTASYQQTIGSHGDGDGEFVGPAGVAVSNHRLYVGDPDSARVEVFGLAKDGTARFQRIVGTTGSFGDGNDQFQGPVGVAVSDHRLYVADTTNHRVQVFSIANNGKLTYRRTIGVTGGGDADNDHFYFPHGLTVALNRLYVADTMNMRVQVFHVARNGTATYEATIGITGDGGPANTQLQEPYRVTVADGRLYVADQFNQRVQVFSAT